MYFSPKVCYSKCRQLFCIMSASQNINSLKLSVSECDSFCIPTVRFSENVYSQNVCNLKISTFLNVGIPEMSYFQNFPNHVFKFHRNLFTDLALKSNRQTDWVIFSFMILSYIDYGNPFVRVQNWLRSKNILFLCETGYERTLCFCTKPFDRFV